MLFQLFCVLDHFQEIFFFTYLLKLLTLTYESFESFKYIVKKNLRSKTVLFYNNKELISLVQIYEGRQLK